MFLRGLGGVYGGRGTIKVHTESFTNLMPDICFVLSTPRPRAPATATATATSIDTRMVYGKKMASYLCRACLFKGNPRGPLDDRRYQPAESKVVVRSTGARRPRGLRLHQHLLHPFPVADPVEGRLVRESVLESGGVRKNVTHLT